MGKTLSFGKGKGHIKHNNREYCTPNVDQSRLQDNIYLVKQDLRDAYQECYGAAIDEYNAKQKRSDRKKSLDGYVDEIKRNQANRNGEKLFYEQVVGIGDMHDSGIVSNPVEADKCKSVLLDYFSEWQERNPNLHVFNAVLHMDEATPHLHIDYIPVGHGYKQGLQTRNSLTRAFENMGIESAKTKENNATIEWQKRERGRITEIAKEHGIEIDSLGIKRDDYTLSDYKALMHDEKKTLSRIKAPKVNRTVIPVLNVGIEWNPNQVDKALKHKTKLKEHSSNFKKASVEAEQVVEHAKSGLEDISRVKEHLQLKEAEFDRYKADYEQLKWRVPALEQKLELQQERIRQMERQQDSLGAIKGAIEHILQKCELPDHARRLLQKVIEKMPGIASTPELVLREQQIENFERQADRMFSEIKSPRDWTGDKIERWKQLKENIRAAGLEKELEKKTSKSPVEKIRESQKQKDMEKRLERDLSSIKRGGIER